MFELQTGNPLNTQKPMIVLYQSIASAAMHEIQSQTIKDITILFSHQSAIKKWCKEQQHSDISLENVKELTEIVLKFHIFDDQGLCKKVDSLVESITTGCPITSKDPIVQKILVESEKYRQNIFNRNFGTITLQINKVDRMSESEYSKTIAASYANNPEYVEVFYKDGRVHCNCKYCNRFFNDLKKIQDIDCTSLNPLQQILAKSYNLI